MPLGHDESMSERGSHECGNVTCCKFDQSSCRLQGSKVAAQPWINWKVTGEESGNVMEVALMTSPTMYIISHTKGTYFPLARITNMIPP